MKSDERSKRGDGQEDSPEPPDTEIRIWEDPRTGVMWKVRRIPAKSSGPGPVPATIVFEGDQGRFWVGYTGGKVLSDMDDTDLILAYDSTAAVAG